MQRSRLTPGTPKIAQITNEHMRHEGNVIDGSYLVEFIEPSDFPKNLPFETEEERDDWTEGKYIVLLEKHLKAIGQETLLVEHLPMLPGYTVQLNNVTILDEIRHNSLVKSVDLDLVMD